MARGHYWRSVNRAIAPLLACLAVSFGPLPIPATTADEPSLEYQVKAAFLLNFTKFVEWPQSAFADATAPFGICVLGKDPFGRTLDDVAEGETVQGRTLAVHRITQLPPGHSCQLLYIDAPPAERARLLEGAGPGVLTVGEGQAFVREGGVIGFIPDNRKVRFDINQSAAERSGLKLSSRLLSVARTVVR